MLHTASQVSLSKGDVIRRVVAQESYQIMPVGGIGSGIHAHNATFPRLAISMGVKFEMHCDKVVVRGVVEVNMTEAATGTVWLINIPRGAGLRYFDGSRALF